jgi:hypothetical protein
MTRRARHHNLHQPVYMVESTHLQRQLAEREMHRPRTIITTVTITITFQGPRLPRSMLRWHCLRLETCRLL